MIQDIKNSIYEFKTLFDKIKDSDIKLLADISQIFIDVIRNNNKLIIFGNGGSAADSQHIACEFVGKFGLVRKAYPAIALTTNTSNLTAIANDFGYKEVFKRQLEALSYPGDVAWGLTTSGNSPNVIEAIKQAKKQDLITVVFTGGDGGEVKSLVDYCLISPSNKTPRIQEFHILAAHVICEIVENNI